MSGNDGPARRFDTSFRCYPAAVLGRGELNYSGMIILPPSALEKLTRLRIAYPMVFELHNVPQQKMTHAGVLEFIAEEKRVYLPHWMMRTLSLKAGELVQIKSTAIPSGSFIKLQPQSTSFITAISDPKGVLENALRRFSTLTKGDKFQFLCKGDIFEIAVLDVKPQHQSGGISCLDTDLEVDFAPPLDYAEPVLTTTTTDTGSGGPGSLVGGGRVTPFTQERSMAKRIGYSALAAPVISTASPQPLRLPSGTLFFGYPIKPVKAGGDKEAEEKKPSMFSSGGGQTLRDATNKKRKYEDINGKGTKSD
ncbi:ubiquitin fusion degradation protein UFD1-domain-containing protein [Sphaerosporella brunnea]|uniref:Ubiquitin fusion degradation protein UFD1-domain-containing protein n=1 Tax=Sphaerosporella brunnea TaxID=1250544 RepID=A0A5J5F4H5_9PEZI|nr:ubiquitin fusion degradation protein UFD1-domain-containing protein [Sphaerosporella brunnea]